MKLPKVAKWTIPERRQAIIDRQEEERKVLQDFAARWAVEQGDPYDVSQKEE